jgi:hypothetical protein
VVLWGLIQKANQQWEEPMSKAKPFSISKQEVWEAYQKVKAHHGAAGVDGQSIAAFEKELKNNLYRIWNRMSSGSDFPPPVRTVKIPKANGGERTLGIPTVSDRIAQMVVKSRLEPNVDPLFHPDSSGYRPGKSALEAVGQTRQRGWKQNWVIDLDIKGFFDNLDHDLLMRAVKKHAKDSWVVLYIERWLKAPAQEEEGHVTARGKGTPQGGVRSPPTKLQTFFFGIGFSRIRIDPKHNIHLMSGDFDPLHKGTNEVPLACPVSPLYTMLHCGGKVFQAANNELQFCLHSRLVRELLALFLQTGDALAYTRNSGRKFQLVDEPIRITVD